ncbi:hypothetical protein BBBOND_0308180 [Babesia bigemina]|uniref:Uncharacterized protein n=1 Tax=Babesia bigemina TaxID=5866 RepID=A0A061DCV7_BABBI|nr:hypothetical protein BBBOND_0308180 [Babesia bigemina]CDR96914.1 hypothetical protein BBBOND_0308180 [Babesia bigemina]|eukprot:XP_012769100.1 hypothetical protein BBBOND_0308180 [Babesia bigemina]
MNVLLPRSVLAALGVVKNVEVKDAHTVNNFTISVQHSANIMSAMRWDVPSVTSTDVNAGVAEEHVRSVPPVPPHLPL